MTEIKSLLISGTLILLLIVVGVNATNLDSTKKACITQNHIPSFTSSAPALITYFTNLLNSQTLVEGWLASVRTEAIELSNNCPNIPYATNAPCTILTSSLQRQAGYQQFNNYQAAPDYSYNCNLIPPPDPDNSAADNDGDGLTNYEETSIYYTDINNPDTDGDLFTDPNEINAGSDPLDSSSTPLGTLLDIDCALGSLDSISDSRDREYIKMKVQSEINTHQSRSPYAIEGKVPASTVIRVLGIKQSEIRGSACTTTPQSDVGHPCNNLNNDANDLVNLDITLGRIISALESGESICAVPEESGIVGGEFNLKCFEETEDYVIDCSLLTKDSLIEELERLELTTKQINAVITSLVEAARNFEDIGTGQAIFQGRYIQNSKVTGSTVYSTENDKGFASIIIMGLIVFVAGINLIMESLIRNYSKKRRRR